MGTYNLAGMKPHAAQATQQLGDRFGIRVIYGFRPVDPYPDHPSGLAADFMITGLANGHAVGQALADFLVANYAAFGVKYIIWNRRVWSAERASEGWRRYSGSNPHTDHVHVTYNSTGGIGMPVNMPGSTQLGYPGQGAVDQLEKMAKTLSRGDFWQRLGVFVAGLLLLLFAFNKITGASKFIPMGKAAKAIQLVKGVKGG